jgi:hypothetical protein
MSLDSMVVLAWYVTLSTGAVMFVWNNSKKEK